MLCIQCRKDMKVLGRVLEMDPDFCSERCKERFDHMTYKLNSGWEPEPLHEYRQRFPRWSVNGPSRHE